MGESYPLAVVIPVRNSASQLGESLPALLDNDLENVEILVVDDASTDATRQVVESIGKVGDGKSRFRYLYLNQHSGPAEARNAGVRETRSPYVFFVDADVVLPKQTIEWVRETLELYSHRSDVVGVLGTYSEIVPWEDFLTNFKNLNVCFLYRWTQTLSPYLHTPIFCIRRDVLEDVGGFDSRFKTAEDFRLGVVLGSRGYRLVIDRRIKGVHLKHYRLGAILREDWQRISDLRGMDMEEGERRFAMRAHRFHRLLSLVLPGLVVAFAALAVMAPIFAKVALGLLFAFYLCNLPLLNYLRKQRGLSFAAQGAAFVFLEMLWAELALAGTLARIDRNHPLP